MESKKIEIKPEEITEVENLTLRELPANVTNFTRELHELERNFENENIATQDEERVKRYAELQHEKANRVFALLDSLGGINNLEKITLENYEHSELVRSFGLSFPGGEKLLLNIYLNSRIGAYKIIHDGVFNYQPKYEISLKYQYPVIETNVSEDVSAERRLPHNRNSASEYTFCSDSLEEKKLNVIEKINQPWWHNRKGLLLTEEQEQKIFSMITELYLKSGDRFNDEDVSVSNHIKSFFGGKYANTAEQYRKEYEVTN